MTANKDRLRLWVEDLESGQHKQASSAMGYQAPDGDKYCCLGRLCEVSMTNGIPLLRIIDPIVRTISYDGESGSYVPDKVCKWIGIDAYDLTAYADMNDRGDTFSAIAAKVRKDYDL